MIANARMYSVSAQAGAQWRSLLSALIARSGLPVEYLEHAEPQPIDELWRRGDLAAVFMCGLPYARAQPRPHLIAAPVPASAEFLNEPRYWSEWVVRWDSDAQRLEDTFGGRLALTVPHSQSGFAGPLAHLAQASARRPLYAELIAPQITPVGALRAVLEGRAEVAPLDAYALRLLQASRPELTRGVRIVGKTAPKPIPPLVSSIGALPALEGAFLEAHRIPEIRPLLEGLLLGRFERPRPAEYEALREEHAQSLRHFRQHPLAARTHAAFADVVG